MRNDMGTLARTEPGALTLKERMALKKSGKAELIIDISSSMNIDIEPGRSRMDAMHEIMQGLKDISSVVVFSDSARRVNLDEIPAKGCGCTYMARAINLIKQEGGTRAVIITDGEASDPTETLEVAKNFGLQILYVGGDKKPDFIDQLAKVGGGFCTKDDISLNGMQAITEKIQLLIGSSDSKPKGDIQL